jgi:hypothetical protein
MENWRWLMSFFNWLGLLFIVIGSVFICYEHYSIRRGEIVQGSVTELVSRPGSKGGTLYAPKIRFTTTDQRVIDFQSGMATSEPGVAVGDLVPISYNRTNPNKALILRFGYRFAIWYCLIGVGLLIIFINFGFTHGNEWIRKTYLS